MASGAGAKPRDELVSKLSPPDSQGPAFTEITGAHWPADGKVRGGDVSGDDHASA
jgi:hypothetical protein